MGTKELAESFARALNAGDLDTAASYLSDEFKFSGPVPEPMNGMEWVGLTKSMYVAFPDINYNLKIVEVDGSTVRSTTQVTGTHTGDLDLTRMGMGVIPATGKSFSNPEEAGEAVVNGDKIVSLHISPSENSGLPGILKQLGIEMPAM
jgi:predicted ester cyclase